MIPHQRIDATPIIGETVYFECGHSEKRRIRLGTLGFQVGLKDDCDGCGTKQRVVKEVADAK